MATGMRSLVTVLTGGLFRLLPIVFLCLAVMACVGRPSLSKPDPYAQAPADNGLAGPPVPTRKERKAAQKDWEAVHPVQVEEAEEAEEATEAAEAEDAAVGAELAQVDEPEADPFILVPVNELLEPAERPMESKRPVALLMHPPRVHDDSTPSRYNASKTSSWLNGDRRTRSR